MIVPQANNYSTRSALRPISLVVALAPCLLGISLAQAAGELHVLNAVLILAVCLLLQAGMNLINDHAGLRNSLILLHLSGAQVKSIRHNYRLGLFCILAACIVGFVLAWLQSWWLLLLGAVAVLGVLFYTGDPVNLRNRGLGIVLAFWLQGQLSVVGSAWAAGAQPQCDMLLQAIPISLLTSLMMIANELRDYEFDRSRRIKTLSVRMGYKAVVWIYLGLIFATYASVALLWTRGLVNFPAVLAVSLLFAIPAVFKLYSAESAKANLPLTVSILMLIFGLAQSAGYWFA